MQRGLVMPKLTKAQLELLLEAAAPDGTYAALSYKPRRRLEELGFVEPRPGRGILSGDIVATPAGRAALKGAGDGNE
jgi:hypothetical protein